MKVFRIVAMAWFFAIAAPSETSAQSPCTGTPSANSMLPSSDFTICAGTSANVSLANSYSNSGITFQWQSSTTSSVGPFTNVFGARGPWYTTPVLHGTRFFNVVITCTNSGISISVPVTVSVVPCYTPCNGVPGNTVIPASQTICAGNSATLSLLNSIQYVSGNQFQWQTSSVGGGPYTAVPGATAGSLVSPTLNATTYFNAVITCTNGNGTYTTGPVAVHVTTCSACTGAPATNQILAPDTVCAGTPVTLMLASTYSNTGITYQWHTSNVSSVGPFTLQPGSSLPSFTSMPLLATTYFYVVITCTNTNINMPVYHTVNVIECTTPCSGTPAASAIFASSDTICAGDQATLTLSTSYSNSAGMAFQWYSATVSSGPLSAIPGATLTGYTTAPMTSNGYYQAVITCTNSGISYTTPIALLTVVTCTSCSGSPGSNTILPASPTICAGTSASLSLANSYTASGYSYQWHVSAISPGGPWFPVTGATGTNYVTPPLNNTVFYNVVITCTNSSQSIVVVNTVSVVACSACNGTPAPNSISPANPTVCIGTSATLALSNSYTATGITYQWQTGVSQSGPWTLVAGANSVSYITPTLSGITYYSVVATCTNSGASAVFTTSVEARPCNVMGANKGEVVMTELQAFPNPSSGLLEVRCSGCDGELALTDLTGRLLDRTNLREGKGFFSTEGLARGVYLVNLNQSGFSRSIRVVRGE